MYIMFDSLSIPVDQRMNGTESDPNVKTFGSSIAGGGNDFDDNFYPDIVIGAYESDSVYMFKYVFFKFFMKKIKSCRYYQTIN